MIRPIRRKNGNLLVLECSAIPGGGFADGTKELAPDDPEYAEWERWMKEQGIKAKSEEKEEKK